MDIRCPRCGEPWDMDCLHEEVLYRNPSKPWYVETKPEGDVYAWLDKQTNLWYSQAVYSTYFEPVSKEFRRNGCVALTSYNTTVCDKFEGSGLVSAIYDILGDDLDGIAAELEDAENMGLL